MRNRMKSSTHARAYAGMGVCREYACLRVCAYSNTLRSYMRLHACMRVRMYARVCVGVCAQSRLRVCKRAAVHVYACACMRACTIAHTPHADLARSCLRACMHVSVAAYLHTHIHASRIYAYRIRAFMHTRARSAYGALRICAAPGTSVRMQTRR